MKNEDRAAIEPMIWHPAEVMAVGLIAIMKGGNGELRHKKPR
jgi:hypothetical protein